MIINCTCYFSNMYVKRTQDIAPICKQMVYHDRADIFIQLMYNENDHLAKQSIFVRCLMSSLASTTPSPP